MKIAIITSGSRGDVQPYLALANGLQKAGHTIRFITHENYADFITNQGIEFWSIPGNVQAIAQNPELSAMLEKGKFLAIMKIMGEEAKKASVNMAQVALSACEDADLILGGLGGLENGIAIGEKLDIPVIPAYLLPFTPTKEFPSVLTPKIPRSLNAISHSLARQIMWQSLRKADEVARKNVLGTTYAPFFGPYQSRVLQNMPTLYAFSPSVIPLPDDWDNNKFITGYWFLNSEENWHPPTNLISFIESGSPPIYIGFGSMNNRDPEATAKTIIEAVLKSKQRAILQSGWGGLQADDLPDSIYMINSIPHTWLFPQMAAVVHHGGVGTTAAGLRAGIPNIIVPFFADQPFWGLRISELGVGPNPIPRKKLSINSLATAIEFSVSNSRVISNAKHLREKINRENGITTAIKIIENAI
jgi:MGT family glycosyltransferase